MSREPARAAYDAVVDVLPLGGTPTSAYALVKRTYSVGRRGLVAAAATPLFHDLRDPSVMPRLVPGCEFYPFKRATDVVVRGYAYAPGGAPTARRSIALSVGDQEKRAAVIGRRVARWSGGTPRFSDPEPFTRMPVTWREAYGGVDPRVPYRPEAGDQVHPGVYPRNPLGKGYVVLDAPAEVELPNLEDPDHPLTEPSLIVGEPGRWHHQPLPWCFEYTLPLMFPRRQWLGAGAAMHLPPDVVLEEVMRGFLRRDWREASARVDDENPPPAFYQEAPFGQRFDALSPGTPVRVVGMSPHRETVELAVPAPPNVTIVVMGEPRPVPARLGTLLIEPALGRASCVWIATLDALPGPLAQSRQGRLPLAVRVDGDEPVSHQPPSLSFLDATAPLPMGAAPGVPTTETRSPRARPHVTTLRLTEAQLRGEAPVPSAEATDPGVPNPDALTLEALGPIVGMDDDGEVTEVQPLEPTPTGGESSGRRTLPDPEDFI